MANMVLGVTRTGDDPRGALSGVIYRDLTANDPDARFCKQCGAKL